jgi:hypothetical protein
MDHAMMRDNAMKWDGASTAGTSAMCAMGSGAQAGKGPEAGGMCAMAPQQGKQMDGMAMQPQGKGGMKGCPMMAKSAQQNMPCCCGSMMKQGT